MDKIRERKIRDAQSQCQHNFGQGRAAATERRTCLKCGVLGERGGWVVVDAAAAQTTQNDLERAEKTIARNAVL